MAQESFYLLHLLKRWCETHAEEQRQHANSCLTCLWDQEKKEHISVLTSICYSPVLYGWECPQALGGFPNLGCDYGTEEVEAFHQVCGPDAPLWQWHQHWACGQGLWATSSGCSPSVWSPGSWGPSCLMPAGAVMPQRLRCYPRCLLPSMSLERREREWTESRGWRW